MIGAGASVPRFAARFSFTDRLGFLADAFWGDLSATYAAIPDRDQTVRTLLACMPFWPWVTSNSTRWPSERSR